MKYGQTTFTKEPIGNFQGNFDEPTIETQTTFFDKLVKKATRELNSSPVDTKKHISAVQSRDAKLHHLYSTLQTNGGHKIHLDLSTELNARMRTDHVFEELMPNHLRAAKGTIRPRDFECLKKAMTTYETFCGKMSDYDLKYVKILVQMCETTPSHNETDAVLGKIQYACSH
jgi:hypothetical protein